MILRRLVMSAVLIGLTGCASPPTMAKPVTAVRTPPLIVLVGDSTVTDEKGWGRGFAELIGPRARVINTAVGGRSSKSFRDEGKWDAALKFRGDLMLIQFGHNDQRGKGPERETDPNTTFKSNLIRYVVDARAAGFKPVLVTSLVRRKFQPDGTIKSDLVPYVEATRAAAAETGAPLIDLHALSLVYFEQLGKSECERIAPRDSKDGKIDTTHLSEPWHEPVGRLVLNELQKIEPDLAAGRDADKRFQSR